MDLCFTDSIEMAPSNARGPEIMQPGTPRLGLGRRYGAGHFSVTFSTADSTATLGQSIPRALAAGRAFSTMPIRVSTSGVNINGGISDRHKAAFVLKNTTLAHQAAATGEESDLSHGSEMARASGGLQDALHGDVSLPLLHQLMAILADSSSLTVKVNDLVIALFSPISWSIWMISSFFRWVCPLRHLCALAWTTALKAGSSWALAKGQPRFSYFAQEQRTRFL